MAKPVKCARCGRENDPSFAFCLDCGLSLKGAPPPSAERTCAHCGTRLQAGFRFCGNCGRAVDAAAAPASVTPAGPTGTAAASRPPPAAGPPLTPRAAAVAAGPRSALRISLVRADGLPGAVYALDREEIVCGRSVGEILLGDDLTVSPRHARFTVREGRIRVEDVGSVAGTFLRLREPRVLASGDEIRLGRQLLRLEPLPREPAPAGAVPWGSPDPGYRMRLAQLLEGGGLGEVFPLRAGENLVGREGGEIVFPSDRYVSGKHARIDVADGSVTLTDLGSSNGTFLKIAAAAEVGPGDQVLVGRQLLRIDG